MYKRILVPTDGSDTAKRGLREAISLAAGRNATLCLLHVVNSDLPIMVEMANAIDFESVHQELRRQGQLVLDEAREVAEAAGLKVEARLRDSKGVRIADAIVDEAKSGGCDLIVIGTHGRRGFQRVLLGSDAEGVLRQSPVPVLLVRDPAAAT